MPELSHKLLVFLFAIVLISCSTPEVKVKKESVEVAETPVSGVLPLYVDQAFYPFIKSEIFTFEALYPKAKIEPTYSSEAIAINNFIQKNVSTIIVGRDFSNEELSAFRTEGYLPSSNKIAKDALAFMVNENFKDSLIKKETIKKLFSGKIDKWNEINPDLPDENIIIVFGENNSSDVSYFLDSKDKHELRNVYAAGSVQKVLDYVSANKYAIGVIGSGWISPNFKEVQENLKEIKVLGVITKDSLKKEVIAYPVQADIANGNYPYLRNVYIWTLNEKTGLGTGFASFIKSDRGQRIILKSGVLPANAPGREIEIVNE